MWSIESNFVTPEPVGLTGLTPWTSSLLPFVIVTSKACHKFLVSERVSLVMSHVGSSTTVHKPHC
ncbi:hypothetical protein Plhal304r1_c057g0143771 [Plasmopara halstedii]